jgi:hypothetical protein
MVHNLKILRLLNINIIIEERIGISSLKLRKVYILTFMCSYRNDDIRFKLNLMRAKYFVKALVTTIL